MKRLSFILLFLIMLLSFFLGTQMILHGDFFYLFDQARDYLLTQNIVTTHKIPLIGTHSGLGGFFHGPLWLCFLVPFYLLGGGDPFVFTYAYVLLAIVTVLAGFFVGKKLYSDTVGIIFSFLLAISPSIWSYVPNTIGVNMLPLVFIFLFYFLIKYIRGDAKSYIFAIFFAGLSLQFETAVSLALIPLVVISFFLNRKKSGKIKIILLSIASFVVSIATFILFDLRHQFLMLHALLSLFTSGHHEAAYLPFSQRITSHYFSFKNAYESVLIQKTIILESLLLLLFFYFLYYAGRKLFKEQLYKEFWFLLLFPLEFYLIYLGYSYPIYPEYLLGLTVPIGLALSIVFISIWEKLFGKIIVIVFLIATLYSAGTIMFVPYQKDTDAGSYLNQKQAAEWLLQDSHGKKVGYFVYTTNTYTYGMDYLLWWESKQKGIIQPVSQKLPTTYLILYPRNAGDAGAYAFWEKNKIRSAAPVVEKKIFSSGITIEKLAIKPGEPAVDPTYYQNLIFR